MQLHRFLERYWKIVFAYIVKKICHDQGDWSQKGLYQYRFWDHLIISKTFQHLRSADQNAKEKNTKKLPMWVTVDNGNFISEQNVLIQFLFYVWWNFFIFSLQRQYFGFFFFCFFPLKILLEMFFQTNSNCIIKKKPYSPYRMTSVMILSTN